MGWGEALLVQINPIVTGIDCRCVCCKGSVSVQICTYVCVRKRERERMTAHGVMKGTSYQNYLWVVSNPGSLSKAYSIVYPLCSNLIPISGSDSLVWYEL